MIFFYLIIFLLGTAIGSFLNVVVYRSEQEESFTKGRSKCPKCSYQIAWYDNLPLLSFLILKGRCRHCKTKISFIYPLMEAITGLIFVIFAWQFDFYTIFYSACYAANYLMLAKFFLNALFWFAILSVFILIFIFDFKHMIIPDELVITGSVLILSKWLFILSMIFILKDNPVVDLNLIEYWEVIKSKILGAFFAGGFFFVFVFFSKEKWMGWGDVKFGLLIGLLLGFPLTVAAMFLFAYPISAIVAIILLSLKRKKRKEAIAFGPFLVIGTMLALLFGDLIVEYFAGVFQCSFY
jgi:prepilin signal peptidase PulO-like enzyme (type II secretory pathway)